MRKYTSFFEWHEKDQKEVGVAEELVASLNGASGKRLHSLEPHHPDPPDCVCRNAANDEIAIEVAEVVCERAASLNAQGKDVVRVWKDGDLAKHIRGMLSVKDAKTFHGGPFVETIVCLFTDEPMLTLSEAETELAATRFGPFSQITSAYLVFSYDPGSKRYPVLALEFAA